MNKKLIMTAAALLALTTLAGCKINAGKGSSSADQTSSSEEIDTRVTVTLDLNYDGAPAATTIKVEKGGYADAPADPEREGYYFDGWFRTPEDGEDAFEFVSTPIDDDITLYAYWTAAYTVTFYLNAPQQEQSVYDSQTVRAGSLATAPVDPKLTGYAFKGWFNTAACEDEDEFSFTRRINANASAYAKWEEPDWSVVKDAIDSYFGLVSSVYGVEVPQFPNSDYEFKQYSDCLLVSGPEKCIADYKPILEAAGWTLDGDTGAHNDYVDLQYADSDDKGFTMYIILKGTGEATTFNPTTYYVATQQNYVSFPETVLSLFTKFENYKVTLNTPNNDPAALVSMFLPAKTDDNKTDEEYYNENLAAMKAAFVAAGFISDSFTSGGEFIIDPAYLAMNQIYAYDEASPLEIKFLSYSYLGVNGAGVSFNKVVPELVANADALAADYNEGAWVPSATLNVDLSSLAPTYAINQKNFIIQYDYFKTTVETNVLGVNSLQGLNAIARAVMMSIANDASWELSVDQSVQYEFQAYSAYHYVVDENGAKDVDAKLYFDLYQGTSGEGQAIYNLGCGYMLKIYFSPASSEWAGDDLADWLALEALEGDKTEVPDYTGSFSVCEAGVSTYGDYYHIFLLNTVDAEAKAYAEAFASNGFSAIAEETDASKGEYAFLSESGNFEVYAYVSEGSFDLVVSAYVLHKANYDVAGLTALNAVLNERNGFTFPLSLVSAFTGSYSGIEYTSYYNTRYSLGHSTVDLISTVTEGGDATAVNADADAVRAYLEANGFERKVSASSGVEYFLDANNNEIHVDVLAPDSTDAEAPATYVLEVTIFAKPAGGATSYTAAKVAEDMNANIAAAGYSFQAKLNAAGTAYTLAVNFGSSTDESEASLKGAVNTLASFLPSYMTLVTAFYDDPANGGYDIFGDGTVTYYAQYKTPDGSVTATLIGYLYSGLKVAQITIKQLKTIN